ncbi:MAG TPA: acyl-protein synthetase [Clostridiales bacterium UBA8960]|nr:acyl-protein synthetase [Clostridiales bacterium UBA8960]
MRQLYSGKNPYIFRGEDGFFLKCVRDNIKNQRTSNSTYEAILNMSNFQEEALLSEADLHKIPVLTSLFFKRNNIITLNPDEVKVKATSSGTKGLQSQLAFDHESYRTGLIMAYRFFSYHKLISGMPTNYIVLGYEPSKHNEAGAIKTAFGVTKFAPAISRVYVMKDTGTDYTLNIGGVEKALKRFAAMPFPVRFVGFPSYLYYLVCELKENGIKLRLHKNSKVILGGGWKQFTDDAIDPETLYKMVDEYLGIPRENCHEFFSAVEHPLPYLKCTYGHFHIPCYSRVIIRDVITFEPVEPGVTGILNFVSPLVGSMPLVSVATDDLAIFYDHRKTPCTCGLEADYFRWVARAGVTQIKTCAVEAAERMEGANR